MKKPGDFLRRKYPFYKCLPLLLVALALMVTGCPHDEFIVELKPQGNSIERTLVFYCVDGVNTNTGAPIYQPFATNKYRGIVAPYPAGSLTNDGERHILHGIFTNALPNDVGGAGAYTNLVTSLGEAGFYEERFRGNDDLAGIYERRFKAADQLADLILGWSRKELGRDPGYDRLQEFLEGQFRRDLRNFSAYWLEAHLVDDRHTNAIDEFIVRFGQYLVERGYFMIGDVPDLLRKTSGDAPQSLFPRIQRLVARKMGVPDTEPVPDSLTFLASEAALEKSWDKYLAGTKLYRAKLKRWEEDRKLTPGIERPKPGQVLNEAMASLIDFNLLDAPDHLVVRLSLSSPPVRSNGRWDEALKQVVWDADITSGTNTARLPVSCYASWVHADESFQIAHIGKVALTGAALIQYCLWHGSLSTAQRNNWDAFLTRLQPGCGLREKLDAFRFPGEMKPTGTNSPANGLDVSEYPRNLLKSALQ